MAYSYTYPIILDALARDKAIGSGVLVEIGSRLLVATAKHVAGDRLQIMFGHDEMLGVPTVTSRLVRHPNLDLAIVELENNPNLPRCSLGMLREDNPIQPTDLAKPNVPCTWIIGFPNTETVRRPDRIDITKTHFGTYPTRIEDDHIEMRYTEGGYRYVDGALIRDASLNRPPGGFSGGGGWMFVEGKPKAGEILMPQNLVRLYAIQHQWNPSSDNRVVHCYSIRTWLRFVFEKYTDLRDCLREQFEFLRERAVN
jgi:hypothetical protein